MGNDERTEMQLKFQYSPHPSVFLTTPKVVGTGLNLTATNHAVLTQKFWVVNEQRQAFARVVRLGQNRVPHTRLLNTGPGGYDNRASDLHRRSGVAQMKSCMAWWADRTSQLWWNSRFQNVMKTIQNSWRSKESSCRQMVRMNDNYLGSVMKLRLFKHSTNTITPTDAKSANGMENEAQWRSPGVLVIIRFCSMLDDYSDEYEMMAMVNWDLVNWIIASFGCSNMWWKAGAPVQWLTRPNSVVP